MPDFEPKFSDPGYQRDPYWDDYLYNQQKLRFKHNFEKSPEQIENADIITDSQVLDKLRRNNWFMDS